MLQKYLITGFFYNAEGRKVQFADIRMPNSRTKKTTQMLEVQRKLREEGCRTVLSVRPV